MVTEYFVCSGPDTAKLHEAVNQAIKNGWQPFGGVAVAMAHDSVTDKYGTVPIMAALFLQAVVRVAAE